jgi:hypothetical protein
VEHRASPRLDVDLAIARDPLQVEVVILGDLTVLLTVVSVIAHFAVSAVFVRGLAMLASGQTCERGEDTTTTSEPSIICSHG